MPNRDEHIRRAELNEEFGHIVTGLDSKFVYWAVVAFGYSALHWVDAFLAHKLGMHPPNHRARRNSLSTNSFLRKNIYKDYRQVMTDCQDARYEMHPFNKQEVKKTLKYLVSIKSCLKQYL